ncbi:MAG: hypothetical protein HY708_07665, partial [Ignavibacteriae bacterium]|nr:hypothetical protein [Ignavibacteriota bacterium]
KTLFNWAMPFKGMKLKRRFDEVGQVVLLCNVHPEMKAWIVVLENPCFALSDKEGNYIIKEAPPGKHSLKIWHEKLKGPPQEVTVPETKDVIVNFDIK